MSSSPGKVKVHSLTGRITDAVMLAAFKSVKRNRGAAGIDGQSIRMFESNLEANLNSLKRRMKRGDYQPKPLRRTYVDKADGSKRPIGVPAVPDRVAQEVLRRLLSPVFEKTFHEHSFGFRPGRNCHQALEKVLELHDAGYRTVLDADIQGFFDNIPHRVIMTALRAEVADGTILTMVERVLRSGVVEDGILRPTTVGTPQGGVISPLLANIVLNQLDWQLHEHGYQFVRYADDFVVLCRTNKQAEGAKALVQHTLDPLGLTLHPEKTRCTTRRKGYEFLGFRIAQGSTRMRDKAVEKFKTKIRLATIRCHNLDAKAVAKLNLIIRGTAKYFATSFSNVYNQFRELDKWIRMRVRCMKYKRKSERDNWRMRRKYLRRWGLVSLMDFIASCKSSRHDSPMGKAPWGRPVPETGTPVNMGN